MKKIITRIFLTLVMVFVLCGFCGVGECKASTIIDTDTSSVDNLTSESTTETESAGKTDETNENTSTETQENISTSVSSDKDVIDSLIDNDIQTFDVNSEGENVEGIFNKIYDKMWSGLGAFQKIIAVFLIICFVYCCGGVIISLLVNKKNIPQFLLGMFVCVVMFICNLYAVEIVASVTKWFSS